jgi:glycosyltransferase involved in cell wall biosynthesis
MSDVAIIVPTFDEARRLDTSAFERFLGTADGAHLLFVDDGSTDGTAAILETLAADHPRASVVRLAENSGKAEAVRRGIVAALEEGADVVGYWDADLSTPLDAIPTLLAVLESDPALVGVIASRVRMLGTSIDRRATRHYTGRVFATIASLALGIAVYDTQCGAKLFRSTPAVREAFSRPFRSRWAFDVEILDRLLPPGTSTDEASALVREVSLATWRDAPGSKLGLVSSVGATWQIVRLGLARRRRAGS